MSGKPSTFLTIFDLPTDLGLLIRRGPSSYTGRCPRRHAVSHSQWSLIEASVAVEVDVTQVAGEFVDGPLKRRQVAAIGRVAEPAFIAGALDELARQGLDAMQVAKLIALMCHSNKAASRQRSLATKAPTSECFLSTTI